MASSPVQRRAPGAIVSSTGSTGFEHCVAPRHGCFPLSLRQAIEDRIEFLIELLDRIDGDVEFEWLAEETDNQGDDSGDASWLEFGSLPEGVSYAEVAAIAAARGEDDECCPDVDGEGDQSGNAHLLPFPDFAVEGNDLILAPT